jgi:hypothetical protein
MRAGGEISVHSARGRSVGGNQMPLRASIKRLKGGAIKAAKRHADNKT